MIIMNARGKIPSAPHWFCPVKFERTFHQIDCTKEIQVGEVNGVRAQGREKRITDGEV